MKFNHVSVKGYERTAAGMKLCLRAELDQQPSRNWSRQFRRAWLSRESDGLAAQIRFTGSDILLYIPNSETLAVTLDALKDTLLEVEGRLGL